MICVDEQEKAKTMGYAQPSSLFYAPSLGLQRCHTRGEVIVSRPSTRRASLRSLDAHAPARTSGVSQRLQLVGVEALWRHQDQRGGPGERVRGDPGDQPRELVARVRELIRRQFQHPQLPKLTGFVWSEALFGLLLAELRWQAD